MPFTPQERREVEALRRKYRIEFRGEVPKHEWPVSHRSTFLAVDELGKRQFETHAARLVAVEDAPWSADVKMQAENLSERARRCVRRNESTWRFACEPYALVRLSSEVVCKRCRQRVWRSEIEATREGNSNTAEALRARQRKRRPCRCPRYFRQGDATEAVGLNRIFGHREDEPIRHEPSIREQLPRSTKPDAVYGLRQSRNIENLLNDTTSVGSRTEDGQDMLVHELLGESPLKEEGDSIVFPFLVLEAKSAMAADSDWDSVRLQSSFPVWTFLRTQILLKNMAEPHSNRKAAPLVWLLMNKGEDWRVSVATVCHDAGEKAGTVGTTDYLLLIVDYVFEWARDIYREDILHELRAIASGQNDCASIVHPDTDIFSTLSSIRPTSPIRISGNAQDSYKKGVEAFQKLDSRHGIIRHATFIESHYRCLLVTRDNVTTMLQSTQGRATKILIRQIIRQLRAYPLSVTWDGLDKIEEQWTGHSRMPRPYYLNKTRFYFSVTYASFLLPNWAQVRELTVIAVAHDAFECLVRALQDSRRRETFQKPLAKKDCDPEAIKKFIAKIRAGNTRYNLLVAIKRICARVCIKDSRIGLIFSDTVSKDTVNYIYNYFKKGRIEPQEPFLLVSSSYDQTHLSSSSEQPFHLDDLSVSTDGCVLVYARGHMHNTRNDKSSICVFFTDGSPDLPTETMLGMAIKNTFENHYVYHTSRIHRAPNLRSLEEYRPERYKEEGRWNIKSSYGIYVEGFEFLHWVLSLKCPPPVRQGSPRNGTGASLFSRNHYVWQEPGNMLWDKCRRRFIIYKTVTQETRYWRSTAQERRNQGIYCCEICAGDMKDMKSICNKCHEGLSTLINECWFQRALLGVQPINSGPINPELENNGQMRLELKYHKPGRLDGKIEKSLSCYEQLDEEFEDLEQLRIQTANFMGDSSREIVYTGLSSRKRRRSTANHSETD